MSFLPCAPRWQPGFLASEQEMAAGFSAVASEFSAVRAEMAEQGASLATQMRVLHEDVIGRIALLQETITGAPRRRSRKK